MQTIAFGMHKQWDSAPQHWELCLVAYDGTWWGMWENVYMCDWATLLYSRKLTEHCKPTLIEKNHKKLKNGKPDLS